MHGSIGNDICCELKFLENLSKTFFFGGGEDFEANLVKIGQKNHFLEMIYSLYEDPSLLLKIKFLK